MNAKDILGTVIEMPPSGLTARVILSMDPADLRCPAGERLSSEPLRPLTVQELIHLHADFVWRSVRRLGVHCDDVDDVTQKVFIRAEERIHEIQRGFERAFLYRLALGFASNEKRFRRRRREDFFQESPPELSVQSRIEEQVTDRQLIDLVLEQLSVDLRAVLVLSDVEGMTGVEIASILEIPVGTVASKLRRAREVARETLVAFRSTRDNRKGGRRQ